MYEADGLDDEEQQELNYDQRMEVERRLNQQDRLKQRNRRIPGAFYEDDEAEYEDDELAKQMRMQRLRDMRQAEGEEDQDMQDVLDYEDVKGQLSQWVVKPEVIRWIRKTFA